MFICSNMSVLIVGIFPRVITISEQVLSQAVPKGKVKCLISFFSQVGHGDIIRIAGEGFAFEGRSVLGVRSSRSGLRDIQTTVIICYGIQTLFLVIEDHEDITKG